METRQSRIARQTGRRIEVIDAIAADLDATAGRWTVLCVDHGHLISTETLALARSWASRPLDWCEACMTGDRSADDETPPSTA